MMILRQAPRSGLIGRLSAGGRLQDGSCVPGGLQVRWASHKATAATSNNKDSHSKRLGIKRYGGMLISEAP